MQVNEDMMFAARKYGISRGPHVVTCCDSSVASGPIFTDYRICMLYFASLQVKVYLSPNPTYNYAIKLVKCSTQRL